MTREEFGKALKQHDWYYNYSDDHRVWKRGQTAQGRLWTAHAELECPYDMSTLCKWAHNMIVEQFAEESPGEWYRQPRKYKSIAPCDRNDLIAEALHSEITLWMTMGGSVEGISQFV